MLFVVLPLYLRLELLSHVRSNSSSKWHMAEINPVHFYQGLCNERQSLLSPWHGVFCAYTVQEPKD